MTAVVQADNGSLIENVAVSAVGTTDQAIEVLGANVRLRHVNCGTSGSSVPQIVVAGDRAFLEDIIVSATTDAGILVTGDRAVLRGITSSANGFTTGDGIRFDTSADSLLDGYMSFQDAFGLRVLDSPRTQCTGVVIRDPHQRGVVWDGSDRGIFDGVVSDAGEHGIQITDSSRNRFSGQVIDASKDANNTYEGVLVDGDSNRNRTEFTVTYGGAGNQMRYGLNISAATCDNNVEASILDGSGATGSFNDAGTGTVLTDDHLV